VRCVIHRVKEKKKRRMTASEADRTSPRVRSRLPPLPHECDSFPESAYDYTDDVMMTSLTVQATNGSASQADLLPSCPSHKHNRLLQTPGEQVSRSLESREVSRRKSEGKKQAVTRKSSLVLFAYGLMLLPSVSSMISDLDKPLELGDIMPLDKRQYDKMRPPKYKGNATEVLFHVTVMSLDTIDESSMVRKHISCFI